MLLGLRGGWKDGVHVDSHPDKRVRKFMYQVREAETEQAIDRIRLIFNEGDKFKPVYIVCNIPLNVKIDTLMTFDQWTGKDKSTLLNDAWATGLPIRNSDCIGSSVAKVDGAGDCSEASDTKGVVNSDCIGSSVTKVDGASNVFGVLPLSAKWLLENVGEIKDRFGADVRFKNPGLSDAEIDEKCLRSIEDILHQIGVNTSFPYIYTIWISGVNKYYRIHGHPGKRKRGISLWGRDETLRSLSVIHGSKASFSQGGESGAGLTTPKIVLTDYEDEDDY